jgi:hypothetical protein
MLIGGPDERELADELLASLLRPEAAGSVAGQTALNDLPRLLSACTLYIGNDSGPKHIASALGVPTIGIHSGVVDAIEWGPVGRRAVALRRNMTCSPCYLAMADHCPRGLACLRQLEPALVHQTAEMLLARPIIALAVETVEEFAPAAEPVVAPIAEAPPAASDDATPQAELEAAAEPEAVPDEPAVQAAAPEPELAAPADTASESVDAAEPEASADLPEPPVIIDMPEPQASADAAAPAASEDEAEQQASAEAELPAEPQAGLKHPADPLPPTLRPTRPVRRNKVKTRRTRQPATA